MSSVSSRRASRGAKRDRPQYTFDDSDSSEGEASWLATAATDSDSDTSEDYDKTTLASLKKRKISWNKKNVSTNKDLSVGGKRKQLQNRSKNNGSTIVQSYNSSGNKSNTNNIPDNSKIEPAVPKVEWPDDWPVEQEDSVRDPALQQRTLAPGLAVRACSGSDIRLQKQQKSKAGMPDTKHLIILPGLLSIKQQQQQQRGQLQTKKTQQQARNNDADGNEKDAAANNGETNADKKEEDTNKKKENLVAKKRTAPPVVLGRLQGLQTNPVLSLQLDQQDPKEELVFKGTRVSTATKFLVLTCQPKQGRVVCKHVFDYATVFGQAQVKKMAAVKGEGGPLAAVSADGTKDEKSETAVSNNMTSDNHSANHDGSAIQTVSSSATATNSSEWNHYGASSRTATTFRSKSDSRKFGRKGTVPKKSNAAASNIVTQQDTSDEEEQACDNDNEAKVLVDLADSGDSDDDGSDGEFRLGRSRGTGAQQQGLEAVSRRPSSSRRARKSVCYQEKAEDGDDDSDDDGEDENGEDDGPDKELEPPAKRRGRNDTIKKKGAAAKSTGKALASKTKQPSKHTTAKGKDNCGEVASEPATSLKGNRKGKNQVLHLDTTDDEEEVQLSSSSGEDHDDESEDDEDDYHPPAKRNRGGNTSGKNTKAKAGKRKREHIDLVDDNSIGNNDGSPTSPIKQKAVDRKVEVRGKEVAPENSDRRGRTAMQPLSALESVGSPTPTRTSSVLSPTSRRRRRKTGTPKTSKKSRAVLDMTNDDEFTFLS